MTDEPRDADLTEEEIAAQSGEPLPDREAMSVIQGGGLHPLPPVDGGETIQPLPPEYA